MSVSASDKIALKNACEALEKFGKFQTIQYFLICLPLVFVAMMNVNYLFVVGDVTYRCRVPECDNANASVERPYWWPDEIDEKCSKPVYYSAISNCSAFDLMQGSEECHEWIYENENSVISELNLACQPWKASLVGSLHNGGMIVSMLLMGWISDGLGRKKCVILCSIGGIVGFIKLYSTNYYVYLVVELLESVLSSGLYTVAIVLMIEVGGQTKRVLAGVIFSYATYVGEVIFAFLAIGFPYWKHLVLIIYIPPILFLVYGLLLKESTRWQMLRGKMEEAKETFCLIAKMNKIDISAEHINNSTDNDLRINFNVESQSETESFRDIIASKEIMTRLAVVSFCFFAAGFVYYGLMVHSVLLPGNKYINFALASVTSFPADLLAFFTFSRYGRRVSLQCGYVACAVFILAQCYVSDEIPWLKVVLFLGGKLGVALCFTGMFTYSLELFPTSVRGSLVGFGNTCSRIGSMLAPLTPLLASELAAMPSILFATTAVTAGMLLALTPETKHLPLFDTIAQITNSKKEVI